MTPLVSFIIPYHNEPEAFLKACVESIRALPLAKDEAEIIVVDDGSKTPTASFCLSGGENVSLPSGRFGGGRYIRQEQAGLSVARNTGLSQAQGLYIQFVDADDCLVPSAYKAVLEELRKGKDDVVMFKMMASTQPPPREREASGGNSLLWKGRGRLFLQHRNLRAAAWGYAFKREILGDFRFYPGLLHEDELFTPQLFLKAKSLSELDAKAYFYRQHEGTITHSKSSEKVQKRLNDIHFIIRELQSLCNPMLERRVRQLTADYLQNIWMLTHSLRELCRRAKELREEGLLPLPLCCYSLRYVFVALLARILAFL